jgi:hypothetical protein
MSLPLRWRECAIQLMRYGVRFAGIGHTGHSDATLLRQKYHGGDEDDRARERQPWLLRQLLTNAAIAASRVGS